MKLWSLEGNRQQLDGGAMFGNCPREVWARWSPPDQQHRIPLACRSLLVQEDSGRRVLFETGVGAFFEPKLRTRYGIVENEHVLLRSLEVIGITPEQIEVVVLSHLHFDHAGGLLSQWREGRSPELGFPNARFLVSEAAWRRSLQPHPRDRASFIPELPGLLEKSGRLERVSSERSELLGDRYSFSFSEGHTPGLMLTRIEASDPGPITFMGDLVPGVPWVHVPITMGYDRYPERLIDEKQRLLERLAVAGEWLFLTHDPNTAACRVRSDERGRFSATDERSSLSPPAV
jgi:glyoxylase-like metal-dependent hydrolase (beta-lactamase superfamily II)